LVTKNQPKDAAMKTFLTWVLGIGQNYCGETGLVHIDQKVAGKFVKELR
jgi:ABC-type phosphate transport system substrate-binding protein